MSPGRADALALTTVPEGVLLLLKVSPGSAKEGLRGLLGDRLKLAVRTPPEKGRANRSVTGLLEAVLELPRRSVTITAGATSSAKTALVRGVTADELRTRIGAALAASK